MVAPRLAAMELRMNRHRAFRPAGRRAKIRGASTSSPTMEAKDSGNPTPAIERGLAISSASSAADRDVRESLSRPSRGPARTKSIIMQARTTEAEAPTSSMYSSTTGTVTAARRRGRWMPTRKDSIIKR